MMKMKTLAPRAWKERNVRGSSAALRTVRQGCGGRGGSAFISPAWTPTPVSSSPPPSCSSTLSTGLRISISSCPLFSAGTDWKPEDRLFKEHREQCLFHLVDCHSEQSNLVNSFILLSHLFWEEPDGFFFFLAPNPIFLDNLPIPKTLSPAPPAFYSL